MPTDSEHTHSIMESWYIIILALRKGYNRVNIFEDLNLDHCISRKSRPQMTTMLILTVNSTILSMAEGSPQDGVSKCSPTVKYDVHN